MTAVSVKGGVSDCVVSVKGGVRSSRSRPVAG